MGGRREILDLKAYNGKGVWFLSVVGTGNENIAQGTVWVVDWGAGIYAHGVSEIFQWEGLGVVSMGGDPSSEMRGSQ